MISATFTKKLILVIPAVIGLGIAQAAAKSDNEILTELNVYGEWAEQCGEPASDTNPFQVFAAPETEGNPGKTLKVGEQSVHFDVTGVQALEGGKVQWTETKDDSAAFEVVTQLEGGRMRTMQSKGADGNVYVQDGNQMLTLTGKQTPWLTKCPSAAKAQ